MNEHHLSQCVCVKVASARMCVPKVSASHADRNSDSVHDAGCAGLSEGECLDHEARLFNSQAPFDTRQLIV